MNTFADAGKIHACTWHELHQHANELARQLAALSSAWSGIVAISRGGLFPAAIIARVLDVRLIDTVCIASYDGRKKGPISILKGPVDAVGDGRGWAMIDDVADTGATAEAARRLLPAATFATVFGKPAGRPFVDISLVQVDQDTWIDFPWDRDPAKL